MISRTYKEVYMQSLFGPDVSAKLIKSQDPFRHTKFCTTHQTVEFSPQDSGDTYVCRDHQTQLMHGERVDLINIHLIAITLS